MTVVFGTVCFDRVRRVPKLPVKGGYIEALSDEQLLGGEAANTANCLIRWGEPVSLYCPPFGDDLEGEILRSLLRGQGLNAQELTPPFRYDPERRIETPACDIYITPDGERTMFGRGFSDSDQWVDVSRIVHYPGQWFTAEPNMPKASRQAVRNAIDAGMRVWLMDFVAKNDTVPPNGVWQTSTVWAGVRNDREANLAFVKSMQGRQGGTVILTDGDRGLALADEHGAEWVEPVKIDKVVDSTGAGDHFRAACLRVMARGGTIREAVRVGRAAGALTCLDLGATTKVRPWDEVVKLSQTVP